MGIIDITNRCNLRCPICFSHAGAADYLYEPTLQEVREMMENLRANNPIKTPALLFSGGDPKFNADYTITFYRGPMEIDPDEEICRVLKEGSEKLLGKTPRYVGGTGWMDTQIIYSKGIPAVAHGPIGYGAHAKEEWVDLKSVYETALVHGYAIKKFCGAN